MAVWQRSKELSTDIFKAADHSSNWSSLYARASDNRMSRWLTSLSRRHLILGSLLQSTLAIGVFMIVVLLAVHLRHPLILALVGIVMWTVTSIWGYAFTKWRLQKEGHPDDLSRPESPRRG
jgi:hypothetical protein